VRVSIACEVLGILIKRYPWKSYTGVAAKGYVHRLVDMVKENTAMAKATT